MAVNNVDTSESLNSYSGSEKKGQKKAHKSVRLFENPYLEALTHVHPITPLVIWIPILGYVFYRSVEVFQLNAIEYALMALAGFFVWSLTEYTLHRYLFHLQSERPALKWFVHFSHGVHHDDPDDPSRLVMPPVPGLILGGIFYLIFTNSMGDKFGETFFLFFMLGYLIYDYIHFSTHHIKPRTFIGRYLKWNHMNHHFVTPEARWGVSSPLWDFVFGSLTEKK